MWNGETGTEVVKTSVDGKFSFAAVIRSSFLGSLFPHEPMIVQTLMIKNQRESYKAWMLDKRDYDQNGELDGNPITIYCDLNAEVTHKGDVYGICDLK